MGFPGRWCLRKGEPVMFVEMAIADSYGAGFEMAPSDFVAKNNFLRENNYLAHPKGTIEPGHYTDDTQWAVALGEFMLSGQPVTPLGLADAFVAAFKRDPRQGYAQRLYDLLLEVRDGADFLHRITPHSNKCGGAMRAAPLGFLNDPKLIRDRAMWQASLTHATKEGMEAAAGAALLVHFCRQGVSVPKLHNMINKYVPGLLLAGWQGTVPTDGCPVVRAAWWAIADPIKSTGSTFIKSEPLTLSTILQRAVAYTGDTDTVAAIAIAAASCHPEIGNDLPGWMYSKLENGPFGLDYLRDLDDRFQEALPCKREVVEPQEPLDNLIDELLNEDNKAM